MSSSTSKESLVKVDHDSKSSINDKPPSTGTTYQEIDEEERAQVLSVQDTQPGVHAKGDWLRRSSRAVKLPKDPFTPATPESDTTPMSATPDVAASAIKRKTPPSPQVCIQPTPSDVASLKEFNLPTPPITSGFHNSEAESSSKKVKLSSDDDSAKDSAIKDVHDTDFSPKPNTTEATPRTMMASQPTKPVERSSDEDQISSGVSLAQTKKTSSSRKVAVEAAQVQSVMMHRPRPHGQPEVWAEGRQDLCETLAWFRAFQSGAYTSKGRVPGFLLDKDCGLRPYIDGEVAITRAGGGCKKNDTTGVLEQMASQDGQSIKISCFQNHKNLRIPVGLIAGSNNMVFPTEIPHRYCVLDWFQVTDTWTEKWNEVICYKIRFEKIELASKSWWVSKESKDPPLSRSFDVTATKATCVKCQAASKQVFELGWICLNHKCKDFWLLAGSKPPVDMKYDPDFLAERTPWPKGIKPPYELKPKPLQENMGNSSDYAFMRVCWKGIVCEYCGRCNSRRLWRGWNCQTPGCEFFYEVKMNILSPRSVLDAHTVEWAGHALPDDTFILPAAMNTLKFRGHWRIHTYTLPSLEKMRPTNILTHFFSNEIINEAPGGPSDMFMRLQEIDVGLQRFPLKSSPLAGEMLTQHFAVNYGMRYKYVVDVDSKPFRDADPVLLSALQRLSWAAIETFKAPEVVEATEVVKAEETADTKETAPPIKFTGFNEELVIGYFESQKIDYHDDGEKDLGPTVATLSLGGGAIMSIRMKRKYYYGCKGEDNYDHEADVVPYSFAYEERMKLRESYGKVSKEEYKAAFEKIMGGKTIPKRGSPPVCLRMELGHGDMVVMHGEDMQKYYEHSVTPTGKLRFALTCRYVRPERIPAKHHWKGVYPNNPEDQYHGDMHLLNESITVNVDASGDEP